MHACLPAAQAHEQLLLELQLQQVAVAWRQQWLRRRVLRGWRSDAAAAVQQRRLQERVAATLGRVHTWLGELQVQRSAGGTAAGSAADAAGVDPDAAAAAAGAWWSSWQPGDDALSDAAASIECGADDAGLAGICWEDDESV